MFSQFPRLLVRLAVGDERVIAKRPCEQRQRRFTLWLALMDFSEPTAH